MKETDIIELTPTPADLMMGADYASITLPWTFNRMMLNTSSSGQKMRGLNIAKGIVAQEMLRRKLDEMGVYTQLERKSYRDNDLFDFEITVNGVPTKLDLKTNNYYTDYAATGREPLTRKLIAQNAAYPGPDWRRFFPMLVPHTQIGQGKEAYGFGITSSIDFRKDISTNRSAYMLTAFPYGENLAFMSSSKLCKMRELANEGFYLDVKYQGDSLSARDGIEISILGEWQGEKTVKTMTLNGRSTAKGIGPFSCIASFQMDRQYFDWFDGEISIKVGKNEFKTPVLDSTKKNVNIPYTTELVFHADDFCNLVLPNDYKMYVIGWTTKEDFLQNCMKYSGWVWPKDSVDKYLNQPWSQITDRDNVSLTRAGFADCIQRRPSSINAGWLKTNGRGGGACCYVFPNIGRNGGIRETNLYVLPQDLSSFTELI